MRALIQRVSESHVTVEDACVGQIDQGLLVLLGVGTGDTEQDAQWLAKKIVGLRIFEDQDGKMNLSVEDVGGAILAVSQFTLYGDCKKGRRPSFVGAAPPQEAEQLFIRFVEEVQALGMRCETGRFRTHMKVSLLNDGPVTLWIESPKRD